MNREVSIFLPTRKGSERIAKKNTRDFAGVKGGLLRIKLEQLCSLQDEIEIILSTNDEESQEIALSMNNSRVTVLERPNELASSSTDLRDLIDYAAEVCRSTHILWTHVTSPFTGQKEYDNALKKYFKVIEQQEYDSLMSGKWFQNFLWSMEEHSVINKREERKWPRTQDLLRYFEVDSAIFIATKQIYLTQRDRIGIKPYLFEQVGLPTFDVDWMEDFEIAEKLYTNEN